MNNTQVSRRQPPPCGRDNVGTCFLSEGWGRGGYVRVVGNVVTSNELFRSGQPGVVYNGNGIGTGMSPGLHWPRSLLSLSAPSRCSRRPELLVFLVEEMTMQIATTGLLVRTRKRTRTRTRTRNERMRMRRKMENGEAGEETRGEEERADKQRDRKERKRGKGKRGEERKGGEREWEGEMMEKEKEREREGRRERERERERKRRKTEKCRRR